MIVDDADAYAAVQVAIERDKYETLVRVLRAERDQARAGREHMVKILIRIHALLGPAPITDKDGKVWRFRYPDPHYMLDALSAEIRAIPDAIAAEAVAEFRPPWGVVAAQSVPQAQTTGVPLTKT